VKPRLLVIELWGLGDLVIASSFLRVASEKFEVTLLAKPYANDLRPRLWPQVRVVSFVAPWTAFHGKYSLYRWPWRRLLGLRRETGDDFAVALSARWDPRDHALMWLIGARQRLGFPRIRSQVFLTHPLDRPDPSAHRLENWRVLGHQLGFEVPGFGPPRAASAARTTILVHSGAGQSVRVWPLENYRATVQRLRALNYQVQVACDADQLNWWLSVGETGVVMPTSVAQLLELVDRAQVFLGNDSGPAHLAAYCGVPTFTLFGPQLLEWFAPLHPQGECFEGKPCPYKPCSDYCRFPQPLCLRGCTTDEVWQAFSQFLNRVAPRTRAA